MSPTFHRICFTSSQTTERARGDHWHPKFIPEPFSEERFQRETDMLRAQPGRPGRPKLLKAEAGSRKRARWRTFFLFPRLSYSLVLTGPRFPNTRPRHGEGTTASARRMWVPTLTPTYTCGWSRESRFHLTGHTFHDCKMEVTRSLGQIGCGDYIRCLSRASRGAWHTWEAQ